MSSHSLLIVTALFTSLWLAPDVARAACSWTVEGRVSVDHGPGFDELGSNSRLHNVQVKVSARTKVLGVWGTWNGWNTVRTDANGSFRVTRTKDCRKRQFKVKVKFDDARLEVRHATATSSTDKVKWYEIHRDQGSTARRAGTLALGEKTFRSRASLDLGNYEARSHASIWATYDKAIAYMAALGPDYSFRTKIKVKYPHNSAIAPDAREASYANPTTKVIYIFKSDKTGRDNLGLRTLLHELGHIWAYNHMSGEICLTEALLITGDTHGLVKDHCVAFGEGFAEYWMDETRRKLWGGSKQLPYNREYVSHGIDGEPVGSIDELQRHDLGWWSVLHMLTTPKLHDYRVREAYDGGPAPAPRIELGPAAMGCTSPTLTFPQVLRTFNEVPGHGYTKKLSREDTTVQAFLERAAAANSGLSQTAAGQIRSLVDPSATTQPRDLFCSPLKKQPALGTIELSK